jgi:hypothetical protein
VGESLRSLWKDLPVAFAGKALPTDPFSTAWRCHLATHLGLFDCVQKDEHVENVLLPIRDGIMLAYKL